MIEDKKNRLRKVIKYISFLVLFIIVLWLCLVLIELYRVKEDMKPIICINTIKDIEDDDEYSKTCYGILYKYREYFDKETNGMTAKEFTLVFKEFERKL